MNSEQRTANNLEIITERAEETKKLGRILAKELLKGNSKRKKAVVIGLEGELGSGKTAFVQGMAKGFGIKQRITSPTFVIMKRYGVHFLGQDKKSLPKGRSPVFFYHLDCYRITEPKDLLDLDFKEIINNSQNIVAIEWAERVRKILPENSLWIKFEHLTEEKRRLIIPRPDLLGASLLKNLGARLLNAVKRSDPGTASL
ncbi:MAG: tRNA (adenosine(37)-N6)-threonylcarbamoyltransferase complex ATPase subunit type 1 TsaE [Candidatus Portnoybacteria bacterium RIFCSPLOWO2_12_FULL_39_9]|uniref:tRNA threonylcarbamoyladenosine biosynthesis protein TsaE n=1 Tax=Candidatus Portnoybacteria bacterium RIFCSPHIGHO2_12_FULL_38_9 TaxID=1801997 RepID=A0A1G2FI26_9BACT|nr:MAG: tRNA (adenosine(37)-N6)-threonylcarbamoyltransferase complex ATPase subunit type 1 TsaE [Candidatus Portnoybacteria bacterium RBG_13_40_8]OGZ36593.1 MAG: tRNA (adenosine(37)-N6)-threonylcarbamoyltransferase complex ATPase subunit type 1 TsaE [Candidatus Portnoybacteria bacterium RIFCSPHIGHO2_02_FULL_39_12]OGZ37487.1 MAG: tRNA (adenosine(37)-N6)-threonylcarbamoyltransferase complex ATPase subunit type 1 TsaE [Candidatus Portnoybacteria bacterium RIFCSPHIGHO2_12_FULL_38_9]OGZ39133.1 MAG: t